MNYTYVLLFCDSEEKTFSSYGKMIEYAESNNLFIRKGLKDIESLKIYYHIVN